MRLTKVETKYEYDGPPQEYANVRHLFEHAGGEETVVKETTQPMPPATAGTMHDDIRRVLANIPKKSGIWQFFRVVNPSGSEGMARTTIAEAMHLDDPQHSLNGILGPLGKLIQNMDGLTFKKGKGNATALLLEQWKASGEWYYRLRPEVREILEADGYLGQ